MHAPDKETHAGNNISLHWLEKKATATCTNTVSLLVPYHPTEPGVSLTLKTAILLTTLAFSEEVTAS